MFIANASRQDFRFQFRVPEHPKIMFEDIPSGGQIELGKDWGNEVIQSIVEQLQRFGAREAKDARGALRRFDSGLIYSVNKPVSQNEIFYAWEEKLDNAQDRSVYQASRASAAADLFHRENGNPHGKRLAREVGMEVERAGDPNRDGRQPLINLTVADDAPQHVSNKDFPIRPQ